MSMPVFSRFNVSGINKKNCTIIFTMNCYKIFRFNLLFIISLLSISTFAQQNIKLKKKDRKRDIELVTTDGVIRLRLYDSTPLHRDNFLKLVKSHYYDSVLFHRVIHNFMIQSGDPLSKRAIPGQALGNGGP